MEGRVIESEDEQEASAQRVSLRARAAPEHVPGELE